MRKTSDKMNADFYDYQGIVNIANNMKLSCQFLKYDWKTRDDDVLPFKMEVEPKIRKRLKELGLKADIDQIGDLSEGIYTVSDWNNYKKIYRFHPSFVTYLADTESTGAFATLWKRLPFRSFYIWFGDREVPAVHYGLDKTVTISHAWGAFVRVHFAEKFIRLGLEVTGNNTGNSKNAKDWKSVGFVLDIPEGMNFDEALDWYVESRKGIEVFNPERTAEVKDFWRPFFRIAMNACQYLCASNAEVQDLRVAKKDKPVIESSGKRVPVSIKVSNVGYRIGESFERMYTKSNDETDNTRVGAKGIKKRPHVRRAHWHHYWTGPGRTVLEVKWLEPIFVMGTEDDVDIVEHRVKGDTV